MMDYIVVDLEWNQSPYGKTRENYKLPFEIVEIGAIKLDENLEPIGEFREIIKPQVYGELHFKIHEITHMSMEELRQGEEFNKVFSRFIKWCGKDYIFCTWGSMDLTELQKNMSYYKIPNTFKKPLLFYDVQKLYSLLYEDGKVRKALDTVIDIMNINEKRPFHRALDDAYYTSQIMRNMEFNRVQQYYSVDYYRLPQTKEEEIRLVFGEYSKYVSRIFETKEEALEDKMVTATRCYYCGKLLRKKIRWFSSNAKFYICLAYCPTHGYMKGKLRIKKADNGKVFIIKTLKLVGEDGAESIRMKQEELRLRRKQKRNKELNSKDRYV